MKLNIYKSLWGMTGTWEEQFRQIAEVGYDGIEVPMPAPEHESRFKKLLKHYALDYIPMALTFGATVDEHLRTLQTELKRAMTFKPSLINVQGSKDYFWYDEQVGFFEQALALAQPMERAGVPVLHETHRTRALFAPNVTGRLLRQFSELKLTSDLSHWCVVCESMLDNQQDDLALACARTHHIHARVGYEQGPQVPDPRAPEWAAHVAKYEAWWKATLATQKKAKREVMTVTVEFGGPHYMHMQPYTAQPVANVWDVNLWMAQRARTWVK